MNQNLPLVSCIIPTFNSERYIAETLESVFVQTYPNIEIIVVLEPSNDRTAEILSHYGSRIKIIENAKRMGPGASVNRGVEAAKGEFLAFLDSDDLWIPTKIEKQLALFAEDPTLEYCVSKFQDFLSPDIKNLSPQSIQPKKEPQLGFLPSALVIKKHAFEKIGKYDPNVFGSHDTDWFIRAKDAGIKYAVVPEVLMKKRLHGKNHSTETHAQSMQEVLKSLHQSLKRKETKANSK